MAVANASRPLRLLLVVCTCILALLIVGALALARAVLLPVALSVLLTFILAPFASRLQRRGLGRVFSVVLVTAVGLLVIGGFTFVVFAQLRNLADSLPSYRANIAAKMEALRGGEQGSFLQKAQRAVDEIHDEIFKPPPDAAGDRPPQKVQVVQTGQQQLQAIAGPTLEFLAMAAMVVFLVVFMLLKREDLRNRVIRLLGHGRLTDTTKALDDAAQRISRYLVMQLCVNAGFGLALGLGLFAIGVPHAFLWGLMAGGLRFLPYVGSPVAALLLGVFSLAAFAGWTQPLWVLGLFVVLEVLTANVLEPLIFGHSTGVSPIALLVAAVFWTWLWGPLGLLMSTPLTVCLVVLGKYVPGLESLDVLLGDEQVLSPRQRFYQRLVARDPEEALDLVDDCLQDHACDEVYDEVLLPALTQARRDRQRGVLTEEDERVLHRQMRHILDEITEEQPQAGPDADSPDRAPVTVLGCPAGDETDELGLRLLKPLLDAPGCRLEVLSADMLTAEVLERVGRDRPPVVCIADLPPVGLSNTRYLCKRLKAQFPEVKVVVGRWGQGDNLERVRARLLAAGADVVTTSLLETRDQIHPLVQVAAATKKQPRKPPAHAATER